MLPEKAKPVLLLLVLACIVNSYLNSDTFKRNDPGFISMRLYEDLVCERRKEEVRDECRVALAKALVPAQLSCLPLFRDLSVCRDPFEGRGKNGCQKEMQQLSECFQTHLGPYGFSDDDIVRLLFGWQKKKNPKKAKPQLNVSKEGEGGEEIAGQQAEKKSDKGDKKTGEEANVENEAPGAGGKPKVEVDQGQGSENGKHYRGR